ncbi:hypothetical protein [Anaeromyxobacter terrae]|uniref:hypothetical protein n=1 Tax=Anaeromyxobacter terrae TaxID=2925406 RepID=UPI001F575D04|nr:hypothetical protein [Anaeromyxobacter sp. SG22]
MRKGHALRPPARRGHELKGFSEVARSDLDGHGNAVGIASPYPSGSSFPVRFDAAKGTFERLYGLNEGVSAVRANDDGLIVTAVGDFWQDGMVWSSGGKPVCDLSDHDWLVGSIQEMDMHTRPWVYDGTTVKIWGGGSPDVFASAVNSAGRVVGKQELDAGLAIGSATVGWSVEILPDSVVLLPIDEPSYAADVSDTGIVVGGLRSFGLARAAYVYNLETGDLRVVEPPEGCVAAALHRIDPSGSVAVGPGFCDWRGDVPLVYFVAEDRLVPLEYLTDLSPGWRLVVAQAVNAHGQILAWGTGGQTGQGETGYFILTPE